MASKHRRMAAGMGPAGDKFARHQERKDRMSRSVRPDNPPAFTPEKQKVIDQIVESLGELQIDTKGATADTSFMRDLGLDSLDVLELTYELEDELADDLKTGLDVDKVMEADTIGAVADYVLGQCRK